jgi:hypothetical protein
MKKVLSSVFTLFGVAHQIHGENGMTREREGKFIVYYRLN